mgnify:CR=1 FL=1|tara:strand:+ start:2336 stop:2890 length:555 start_codon:yes stop_codon:yes gene_type:complete
MCNPTLVVAGLSAGMQYQQGMAQQKAMQAQQIRQNQIAKNNQIQRSQAESLKLKQSTEKNLEKLRLAEGESRRRRATFMTGKNYTGNTYNMLLANYYDQEGQYRNTVLGNIQKNVFQFDRTQEALQTQYDAQATYVTTPDFMYTAGASALNFAGSYYDYKAKQNQAGTNVDKYSYRTVEDWTDV